MNSINPIVIKVGGSFFDSLEEADSGQILFRAIKQLQSKQLPVILVHGGGDQVKQRLGSLGYESVRKDGLRVTPDAHMPIVSSVLCGELNKQLVAQCVSNDISAVGISLVDGDICRAHSIDQDLGAVGAPINSNNRFLELLVSSGYVPVIASIGVDEHGRLYNINADHAAICIAKMMSSELYFFADVDGVLDQNKHPLHQLSASQINELISTEVITDGMTVKVKSALSAAEEIGHAVTIASWKQAVNILIEKRQVGTRIIP